MRSKEQNISGNTRLYVEHLLLPDYRISVSVQNMYSIAENTSESEILPVEENIFVLIKLCLRISSIPSIHDGVALDLKLRIHNLKFRIHVSNVKIYDSSLSSELTIQT